MFTRLAHGTGPMRQKDHRGSAHSEGRNRQEAAKRIGPMGVGPWLSAIRAAATGQRLDALALFTRLLINGGVPEVDVPVQARMRMVLFLGCCVEGIAGWRYSGLVHSEPPSSVGRVPGCS